MVYEFLTDILSYPDNTSSYIYLRGQGSPGIALSSQFRYQWYPEKVEDLKYYARRSNREQINLFFSPSLRNEEGNKKKHFLCSKTLWVDLDGKDFSGGKEEALSALTHASLSTLEPSYVVDSGNGYHAYWVLDDFLYDRLLLEQTNKGIAVVTGGDKTHNCNRVLRVPGTKNWKDKNNPKECVIVASSRKVYNIKDFEYFRAIGEELMIGSIEVDDIELDVESLEPTNVDDVKRMIGLHWENLIRHGLEADHEGKYGCDRSNLDYAVMLRLVRVKAPDNYILGLFINPEYGIALKSLGLEPIQRSQYLMHSLQKAKAQVEETSLTA